MRRKFLETITKNGQVPIDRHSPRFWQVEIGLSDWKRKRTLADFRDAMGGVLEWVGGLLRTRNGSSCITHLPNCRGQH
jgi:hypothetical protein